MTTITAAIRTARSQVKMVRSGRGQWQVNTWSESHRAWWQGHSEDYARARRGASNYIVATALVELGADYGDAHAEAHSNEGLGTIRRRVKAAAQSQGLL